MEIDAAKEGDAAAAREIAQAAYARYLGRMDRRPAPMDADFDAAAADGTLRILRDRGQVLGYMISRPAGADWFVENLAIDPRRQSAGLGAALMAEAERLARAAGCEAVALYTNVAMTEAIGFYRARGFAETGRRWEDGFHRVHFRRPLSP